MSKAARSILPIGGMCGAPENREMMKSGMRKIGGGFLGFVAIICLWFVYENLAHAEITRSTFEWKVMK